MPATSSGSPDRRSARRAPRRGRPHADGDRPGGVRIVEEVTHRVDRHARGDLPGGAPSHAVGQEEQPAVLEDREAVLVRVADHARMGDPGGFKDEVTLHGASLQLARRHALPDCRTTGARLPSSRHPHPSGAFIGPIARHGVLRLLILPPAPSARSEPTRQAIGRVHQDQASGRARPRLSAPGSARCSDRASRCAPVAVPFPTSRFAAASRAASRPGPAGRRADRALGLPGDAVARRPRHGTANRSGAAAGARAQREAEPPIVGALLHDALEVAARRGGRRPGARSDPCCPRRPRRP